MGTIPMPRHRVFSRTGGKGGGVPSWCAHKRLKPRGGSRGQEGSPLSRKEKSERGETASRTNGTERMSGEKETGK